MSDTSLSQAIDKQTNATWLSRIFSEQVFWVFITAIVACIAMSFATDKFTTGANVFNVTRNFAFVGIIAIGMTAVIVTGGIDLSVGSVVVVSAMVTSVIMAAGYPLIVALPAAILASLFIGLINGILIAVVGIPPFVVTLGMLSIARSQGMVLSDNKMIFQFGPDNDLLLAIGGGSTFGLPNPIFVMVFLALVTAFAFRFTRWGRYVFAIGGNERAATLTGVPVRWVKISVYMFASFTAGITGFLMAGWLGSVTSNLGQSMELNVIAAAVIGGANLAGGVGSALGAVVGALLIEVIRNALVLLGISAFWQGTFVGSFIILAVTLERIRSARAA